MYQFCVTHFSWKRRNLIIENHKCSIVKMEWHTIKNRILMENIINLYYFFYQLFSVIFSVVKQIIYHGGGLGVFFWGGGYLREMHVLRIPFSVSRPVFSAITLPNIMYLIKIVSR